MKNKKKSYNLSTLLFTIAALSAIIATLLLANISLDRCMKKGGTLRHCINF